MGPLTANLFGELSVIIVITNEGFSQVIDDFECYLSTVRLPCKPAGESVDDQIDFRGIKLQGDFWFVRHILSPFLRGKSLSLARRRWGERIRGLL